MIGVTRDVGGESQLLEITSSDCSYQITSLKHLTLLVRLRDCKNENNYFM